MHKGDTILCSCFQVLLVCLTYCCCGHCSSFSTTVNGNCLNGLHSISGHFSYSMAWLELYCQKYFGSGMLVPTVNLCMIMLFDSVLPMINSYIMTKIIVYFVSALCSLDGNQYLLTHKGRCL
jgi:hypothetical protein